MNSKDGYQSYLFRFQRVYQGDRPSWVASSQSTRTGELRRYPSLDALIEFLRDEFGEEARLDSSRDGVNTSPK